MEQAALKTAEETDEDVPTLTDDDIAKIVLDMDEKSDNKPVPGTQIDAIQKHVEESLLFLDHEKTGNGSKDIQNVDDNSANPVKKIVWEPMKLENNEEKQTDLCKNHDDCDDKSNVVSIEIENESLALIEQVLQPLISTSVKSNELSMTVADKPVDMDQSVKKNNDDLDSQIIESSITVREINNIYLVREVNRDIPEKMNIDNNNENSDDNLKTQVLSIPVIDDVSMIKDKQEGEIVDNPKQVTYNENLNETTLTKNNELVSHYIPQETDKPNIQLKEQITEDPNQKISEIVDESMEEGQGSAILTENIEQPVDDDNTNNIGEEMNKDQINSKEILCESMETIHVDEITQAESENYPDVETIILDENVNVKTNEALAQAVEEDSEILETNDDPVLVEVTTNEKHVWEGQVNENVSNRDHNIVHNAKSAHSIALKTVSVQNKPNFDEDVVLKENSELGKVRVIPILNLTEKHPNLQPHTSCSKKAQYVCIPETTVSNTTQKCQDDKVSEHLSTIRVVPLHDLTGEVPEPHKSTNTEESTQSIKRMCSKNVFTLAECAPAKRAKVEPTITDIKTDDVELNLSGLTPSAPVEDLTVDSDDDTGQIAEPATLSLDNIKEFYKWAAIYLRTEKKNVIANGSFAKKHNTGVLRLGNLPNSYNIQDVYCLVKKYTSHAGKEISQDIAFIYNDKSRQPPFCTAYVKWKSRDVLLALKAMELFRQAEVTLQGHPITCRYDSGLKVQWDVNDRPIIIDKKPALKAKQPITTARVEPFVNGSINMMVKHYGLSSSFLESLNITPPLTCYVTVKNLDIKVDERQARNIFRVAGIILTLRLEPDEDSLTAWIQYDHPLEAVQAISMFNKQEYNNRALELTMIESLPPKAPIQGFTKLGPGLGKNGAVLKGKGISTEIDLIKKHSLKGLNKLRTEFTASKLNVQIALKKQQEINAKLEKKPASLTESLQNSVSARSAQDVISMLSTAIASSVQNSLLSVLGLQPGLGLTAPNTQTGSNMQPAPIMQKVANTQAVPNMQTSKLNSVQPVENIQKEPNSQTKLNAQTSPNVPTPNKTSQYKVKSKFDKKKLQKTPTRNIQSCWDVRKITNMPTSMYNANLQIRPNIQTSSNMQYNPLTQTGNNMQVTPTIPVAQYPNMQTADNATPTMPISLYNPNMQAPQYNPNMQTELNMQVTPTMPTQYNPNMQTPQHNPNMQTELNLQAASSMPTQYNHMQTWPNMQQYSYVQTTMLMENMRNVQTTNNAQSNLGTAYDPTQLNVQPAYPYVMPTQNPTIPIQPLHNANISIPTTDQINSTSPKTFDRNPNSVSQDQNKQNRNQIESLPVKYNFPSNKVDVPLKTLTTLPKPTTVQKSPKPEGIKFKVAESKVQTIPNVKPQKRDSSGEYVGHESKQTAMSAEKDVSWINKQIKALRRSSKSPELRVKSPKIDKSRSRDRSREREAEKQKEIERRKEAERMKEKQKELDRKREIERIKEKQRDIERQREEDRTKEKQREIERQRDADRAKDKYRESDRHRDGDYGRPQALIFKYLPPSVTSDDLRDKMGEIGKVVSAQMTGKGQALVIFRNSADAEDCIDMYNRSKVDGHTIEVKWK